MYPEVEHYLKIAEEARETCRRLENDKYSATRTLADAEPDYQERRVLWNIYDNAVTEARQAQGKKVKEAWDTLAGHSDPLVGWIHDNFSGPGTDGDDYREHAEGVLEVLPLDYEGLQNLQVEQGWCNVFERFLADAVEAGVVKNAPKPTPPARKALFDYFGYRLDNLTLNRMVDAVIQEAVAQLEADAAK